MTNSRNKWIESIYAIVIAIYPILSIYATPIENLSIADFLLVFLSIALTIRLLNHPKRISIETKKINYVFLLFFFYILLSFIVQLLLKTGVGFLSTFRYLLYLYALIVFTKLFDFSLAVKILGFFVIASSIYVIIQFIALRFFSIVLPWHISFLKVIDQSFDQLVSSAYYLEYHRPTGFFYEPTHFSQYCLTYICYLLFVSKNKSKWLWIVVVSIAILCCGSSAGLFMLAIAFALFIFESLFEKRKLLQTTFIIAISLIGLFLVATIPYFSTIVNRVFTNGGFSGAAVGYRFDSIKTLFDGSRTLTQLLFGTGRGTENGHYFTAIFYIINAHGFIGLFIYVLIFIVTFICCKSKYVRNALILIFVVSIGSEMICNFGVLTYFSFLIPYKLNKTNSRIGVMYA